MVKEFYTALHNVDTYKDELEVYIHGRLIRISPDRLSTYLCISRQVGANPAVEPAMALSPEEIYKLITGEDQYLVQSLVSQSTLPSFWRMFHLIVSHNIFPKQHQTECTAECAQVILMMARLKQFDLPLFIFQTKRTEAQSTSKEGLQYGNMLTQLIVDDGVDAKR
ncbi:hypothetical protein CJ030_MR5G006244 [Morella rubra]|uniref:Putative plant transposon protein domain-containing protein n=1 Tax=Morella rubra TaxID=262757 RepID=A0A6A1VNP6_9ROSI|nr:hypothetical protein CJ030_MR5G006244 [Morella rubra]